MGVVILSAARTAIGKFGGMFRGASSLDLSVPCARAALERSGLEAEMVERCVWGNVVQAGAGQNLARQVALSSGLPLSSSALTANQVCASGMAAVEIAAGQILLGDSDLALAGGSESMSSAPFYLDARWGRKYGSMQAVDGLERDGLSDAFSGLAMGITAENVAEKFSVSRTDQDLFALSSQKKALAAMRRGDFEDEIVPVQAGGKERSEDESVRETSLEKLSCLKPAFKEGGTVTAGNSSPISDGAAALLLSSDAFSQKMGLSPLAKIDCFAQVGTDPATMGYAPKMAIEKLAAKGQFSLKDIDLFEINEAFASQSVAVIRDLGLEEERVNVNGGAIALGHPLGCSGARILVTLIYALKNRGLRTGIASLCVGGGMGVAMKVSLV
ncbi:MAG: thiolase family protein [Aeriscardovia sp.]|nr:thiolase family protein [Aeriscardovia sp.]